MSNINAKSTNVVDFCDMVKKEVLDKMSKEDPLFYAALTFKGSNDEFLQYCAHINKQQEKARRNSR